MDRRQALEDLKQQIIKNITERGIDEGYNLDFILNEEDEETDNKKEEAR